MSSIGNGKIIVEFFSDEIVDSVWKWEKKYKIILINGKKKKKEEMEVKIKDRPVDILVVRRQDFRP